jgi:nicotinamide-nucleotide amidase
MPFRIPSRRPSRCIAPRLVRRANEIASVLKSKHLTLVTAESCTAGLIAATLSQTKGATDVLAGGFIVYTKEQKIQALGVSKKLLKTHSAVNTKVAAQLARGALKRSRANIALSITGVLGPKPDEDGNPVGLVYFGFAKGRGAPLTLRVQFARQSHDRLRSAVIMQAFDFLADALGRDTKYSLPPNT